MKVFATNLLSFFTAFPLNSRDELPSLNSLFSSDNNAMKVNGFCRGSRVIRSAADCHSRALTGLHVDGGGGFNLCFIIVFDVDEYSEGI